VITALLLAAGASRRFGAPKLLQHLDGKPVVRWSVERLAGLPLAEIVVVVPPEHEAVQRALAGLAVRFVVNPEPEGGIGTSIACGVAALREGTEAVLVCLGDEPFASRHAAQRVVDRFRSSDAGDAAIVQPMFQKIPGHPVLFSRVVFPELLALTGDHGARGVTLRDPTRVAVVSIDSPGPTDVDTPADLELLRTQAPLAGPLLDTLLPEYHVRAAYGLNVAAPAATVYRALLETNLADSWVTRTLMGLRSLGRRADGPFRLRDLPRHGAFFRLGEDPPRELVIGVVGRFWAVRGGVCDSDPESFRAPPPAGTAKAAWNFRIEPAPDGSRLTTETRVLCADADSRRSFRRYWRVIGPFSGIIRMEALRLIRRQAQFITSPVSRTP
jgi:molybdenum cofactor cytidylyltransferase